MKTPVKSSNINAVDFNPADNTLTIEFNTGRSYRYDHCTPEVYQAFMESPSKGTYFAQNIKNVLPATALDKD